MRRLSVVLVVALAALGLAPSSAYADGGSYPSNAPTVASGTTVTGSAAQTALAGGGNYHAQAGRAGVQYYKVARTFGQRLFVNLTTVTGPGTGLCVLAPDVTDATLAGSTCLVEKKTDNATKTAGLEFGAPDDGTYLLAVYDDTACACAWAYSMSATVLLTSNISADGPLHRVRSGQKIKITGYGSDVAPEVGTVTLQRKRKAAGWRTVDTSTTKANGRYQVGVRAGRPGRYKFRVLFSAPGYAVATSPGIWVRVTPG